MKTFKKIFVVVYFFYFCIVLALGMAGILDGLTQWATALIVFFLISGLAPGFIWSIKWEEL
jgi:phosphoglycerol transferase MdoB-like AlkP superfamily enzyme